MVSILGVVNYVVKWLERLWHILLVTFIGRKTGQIPPISDDTLLQSATILAEKIRTKKLKSEEIVKAYVKRIHHVNPIISAVCDERYKDAIEEAREVDKFIATTSKSVEEIQRNTPFLGVPITTKNMVGVKGLAMDACTLHLKGNIAEKDSEVMSLLRKAGAIPLLVSNVPETLMWIDAANSVYGRTLNPYDLTKVPGGSSGGEGALIGSACSVIGFGTDIGGSIRIPAYCCGIFGHKTTKDIVSNNGNLFVKGRCSWSPYKVTGPFCRYAEDLIPMLKIMAGENSVYLNLDEKVDVRNLQIFYVDSFSDNELISSISPEMIQSVTEATNYLDKICKNKSTPLSFNVPQNEQQSIFMTELAAAKDYNPCQDLTGKTFEEFGLFSEIIKYVFRQSKYTMYLLIYLTAVAFAKRSSPELIYKNHKKLDELHRYLKETLGPNGVLIMPTQPQPHYYHYETLFKVKGTCYTSIWNLLGFPATHCPTGLNTEGLPKGVQIISLEHNDRLTIAVAKELAEGFGGWQSP